MTEPDKYDPPEESVDDHVHTLARAGVGSIPLAGATATELFNKLVVPPLEKRRQAWMESVAQGLRTLEEKADLDLDSLRSNDAFIDTVMQASQAAVRNSQQEKLESLRNAVLNAALPNPPEESLQQIFVNLVDTFTVWHLRLLDLFDDPKRWFQENERQPPDLMIGGLSNVLDAAYPELGGRREFYDQIVTDLHNRGLLGVDSLYK